MASVAIMGLSAAVPCRVTGLVSEAGVVSRQLRLPLRWRPMTMRAMASKRNIIVRASYGGESGKDDKGTKPAESASLSSTSTDNVAGSFGQSRKDVILIGLGVILGGVCIKSGLEFAGMDPSRAGNVVQITFVFGLMVAWTFSYVFRVANKEMTYAQQLKAYEEAVIEKRLEEMPEADLETMLAEIEEEKRRLRQQ